jgi:hypothetical protein
MTLPVYNLTLPIAAIETIGVALGEAPFKLAAPVIHEIRRQMAEQDEQFALAQKGESA